CCASVHERYGACGSAARFKPRKSDEGFCIAASCLRNFPGSELCGVPERERGRPALVQRRMRTGNGRPIPCEMKRMVGEQLHTLGGLAALLGLPRKWLRKEALARRIPCVRVGRRLLRRSSCRAGAGRTRGC